MLNIFKFCVIGYCLEHFSHMETSDITNHGLDNLL